MSTPKQETANSIKSFISNIAARNYKEANTFLHKTVENKIKERIQQSLATKN